MSLTCYEEIGRVGHVHEDATRTLATFRPSRHVKMVWRVASMPATSRARRIWRTTRQTDKLNGEVAGILLFTGGCYEETASVELRLYGSALSGTEPVVTFISDVYCIALRRRKAPYGAERYHTLPHPV